MKKKNIAILIVVIAVVISLATVGAIAKREEMRQETMVSEKKNEQINEEQEKTVEIALYFTGENAEKLGSEKREVNYEVYKQNPVKVIVEELIKGPLNPNLYSIVPSGTVLRSSELKDRTVILDFSKEFMENHNGGSTGESMTIFGIVNSLTELKDVDSVEFKIEGEKREEFKGHFIFNEPFERDEKMINK